MKKILLTGSTGYIGRRLKDKLLKDPNIKLRLFVRNAKKIPQSIKDQVEIVEGNTFEKSSLTKALQGIDVAFYLIHSMGTKQDFATLDKISAENFRNACVEAKVERIIYLGGLGSKKTASKHLLSRIQTGEILSSVHPPTKTIWFRAGVIIGSGSASFEIIRNLVQKLPVMTAPAWVNTKTEAIAIDDVLAYLHAAIDLDTKHNLVVDIGSGKMTFKDMLYKAAKVMGLPRIILPVPILTPKLSSYWLILLSPVNFKIASALVEGLKSETVKQNDNAAQHFPQIQPINFEQSVQNAIREIEENQVISRWCDSSAGEICDIKYQEDTSSAIFTDRRSVDIKDIDPAKVFESICRIGGEEGWFTYQFLWEIRGLMDKSIGGCGMSRKRRDRYELRVGDVVDCWKVVDLQKDKRLLMVSQMKLPGRAWLEYVIENNKLIQTAYFYPEGLTGRVYWYYFHLFHCLIFEDMAKKLVTRASTL